MAQTVYNLMMERRIQICLNEHRATNSKNAFLTKAAGATTLVKNKIVTSAFSFQIYVIARSSRLRNHHKPLFSPIIN